MLKDLVLAGGCWQVGAGRCASLLPPLVQLKLDSLKALPICPTLTCVYTLFRKGLVEMFYNSNEQQFVYNIENLSLSVELI